MKKREHAITRWPMRSERNVLRKWWQSARDRLRNPMSTGSLGDRQSSREALRLIRQHSEANMRRRAKVDGNQPEIVEAIRAAGWSVQSLAMVGKGCPDLLIGKGWLHAILELKIPGEKLNDLQKDWHGRWHGEVYTVESIADAMKVIAACEARMNAPVNQKQPSAGARPPADDLPLPSRPL